MKIKNAVIIHGPGRSGTTLLNNILALHDNFAWVSGYANRYPDKLWLTYFNRLQNYSAFEKINRGKRRFPRPAEAYNFWLYHVPYFNEKDCVTIPVDEVEKAIRAINKIISYSGKKRFLTKITGNSRHQTIQAVFEKPFVIWIDRNPKAVIMSYYKQRWNYKNRHELFESIPKKELLYEYYLLYKSFQEEKKHLEKFNLRSFKYEDLVSDKLRFFKTICSFTGIEFTDKFEKLIESWKVEKGLNSNYKKYISEEEEAYLDGLISKK